MDPSRLEPLGEFVWRLPPAKGMGVPAVFFADRDLLSSLDEAVLRQMAGVASLPGAIAPVAAMPDAHVGYGFPIGGVAAFDPEAGGVVSAGGVGYDIACGVRTLVTGLPREMFLGVRERLADRMFASIPAGVGSTGALSLKGRDMDAMLEGGAVWAVRQGMGERADLDRMEGGGRIAGADPNMVSDQAKKCQIAETGTLGSGNHYLEFQSVSEIFDAKAAGIYGLARGDTVVSIHCGSRGLGHQVASDYLARMRQDAPGHGLVLSDPDLACAPIRSDLGRRYLAAMRAACNCALANRQVLTHLVRRVWAEFFPGSFPRLLSDVCHNTCQEETHLVEGKPRTVFVHRKGATRAFGPSHPDLPAWLKGVGQPLGVGGSMGANSYILAGEDRSLDLAFGSACHGAGRALSRGQASRRFPGRDVAARLAEAGILVRAHGYKGLSEEAPGAYKDIDRVVRAAVGAGLVRMVARLEPMVCIKG